MIKVVDFQVIHFVTDSAESREEWDKPPKQVQAILIYALGEDGVVYEYAGPRGWQGYPIDPNVVKPAQVVPSIIPRR